MTNIIIIDDIDKDNNVIENISKCKTKVINKDHTLYEVFKILGDINAFDE